MKITEAHFGGLELYRGWDLSPLAAASGSLVADRCSGTEDRWMFLISFT